MATQHSRSAARMMMAPAVILLLGWMLVPLIMTLWSSFRKYLKITPEDGDWQETVGVSERLGSDTFLHVEVDGIGKVTVRADGDLDVNYGDRITLSPDPARIHRFDPNGKILA